MREAVEQYLEREEKREQLRQDVMAAWADYQSNGLHVTDREADARLAKLAAGKVPGVPEARMQCGAR